MVRDENVFMLHNGGGDGLSNVANTIKTGSNSGYQAINIAVLAGAKRVLLVGYDMHFPGGKSHWHAGHPVRSDEGQYVTYAKRFSTMLDPLRAAQCEVVNCTPGSKIEAFRFSILEKELAA